MADPLNVAPDSPAKVVLDVWEEIFNQHNLEAADRLVSEDYAQNTEGVPGGRAGFKAAFSMYLEMSPDLRVEPKSIVTVDEDIVIIVARYSWTTHRRAIHHPLRLWIFSVSGTE